jgi:hypothetical protein
MSKRRSAHSPARPPDDQTILWCAKALYELTHIAPALLDGAIRAHLDATLV